MGRPFRTCISPALADAVCGSRFGKLCRGIRRNGQAGTFSDLPDPYQCLYSQGGLLLFIQQSFMEPVLRAAVLFLFSVPNTAGKALQTTALCVSCYGDSGRCRHVPDTTGRNKRILVCQSDNPFPGFHTRYVAVPAI